MTKKNGNLAVIFLEQISLEYNYTLGKEITLNQRGRNDNDFIHSVKSNAIRKKTSCQSQAVVYNVLVEHTPQIS